MPCSRGMRRSCGLGGMYETILCMQSYKRHGCTTVEYPRAACNALANIAM